MHLRYSYKFAKKILNLNFGETSTEKHIES